MSIAVYKFGGTSLSTKEGRQCCLKKVKKAVNEGKSLVAVVSAMGRYGDSYSTDELLALYSNKADDREKAILFSCGEIISGCVFTSLLKENGFKAVFLSGSEAGILTDSRFFNAEIKNIDTKPVLNYLKEGYIVVVAGCQGKNEEGNVTILKRGGSDITASSLGHFLLASEVRIFTDVKGVFTSDPKSSKNAQLLKKISFTDLRKMSEKGAKVIHPDAITFLEKDSTPLIICSSFTDEKGTEVGNF